MLMFYTFIKNKKEEEKKRKKKKQKSRDYQFVQVIIFNTLDILMLSYEFCLKHQMLATMNDVFTVFEGK